MAGSNLQPQSRAPVGTTILGRPSSFPDGKERILLTLIKKHQFNIKHSPPFHATRATCHQKAAATADKIDSSGTAQAQPKQRPVQPAPASAANNPNGLRMTCPWPPDQIQLQSPSQRGQRLQPPP